MYLSHRTSICWICLLVVKNISAVHLGKGTAKSRPFTAKICAVYFLRYTGNWDTALFFEEK